MSKNGWNDERSYDKEPENSYERIPRNSYEREPEREYYRDEYKDDYMRNPYQKKDDCCCEKDFEILFNLLLCNDKFRTLLDANAQFGFIGKEYFIGAQPHEHLSTNPDNIDLLQVTAVSFDPCNCGFISLPNGGANVYRPYVPEAIGNPDLSVGRLSLCSLDAFGIGFVPTPGVPGTRLSNYNAFKEALDKCINEHDDCCELHPCKKTDCKDCCCNESILNQIDCSMGGLNITAGWLALNGYDYFGRIGDIAIFNTRSAGLLSPRLRFYFVCLNSVFGF